MFVKVRVGLRSNANEQIFGILWDIMAAIANHSTGILQERLIWMPGLKKVMSIK